MKYLILLILTYSNFSFSITLEEAQNTADQIIFNSRLKALEAPGVANQKLYDLGKELFFDNELSGNRNISCSSCHDPKFYSADALPLGIGQGGIFNNKIALGKGAILKRHTPHLINSGYSDVPRLFWDGRVSFSRGIWQTPFSDFNGKEPKNKLVTKFKSVLAMQSIFPLINRDEMMGHEGENEIANELSENLQWEKISKRILKIDRYKKLISDAGLKASLDIADIGNALAEFVTYFFASYNTPYDKYLRGEKIAMDLQSLEGMAVFFGKARCFQCHNGVHLSNFQFLSSGSPQLMINNQVDFGRHEITGRGKDKFLFKTPPLRNIALTAPYMHSGSLKNLKELALHYNNIESSLDNYVLNKNLSSFYNDQISYDNNTGNNELRLIQVSLGPFIAGLKLSQKEGDDLIYFLENALTDQDFKRRMDSF